MFAYLWPLGLVVLSNVAYQVCAKGVPEGLNPFASLIVTYLVGAAVSAILFFATGRGVSLGSELAKTNWAPLVLGISIVGLEAGYIYAFRAGWPVSTAQIVQAAALAVIMLFVGFFFYQEKLSWNKAAGIVICLIGLGIINYK